MTEDQEKRKKVAPPSTLDLSGEDITALDDDAVASLLQEALDEAVDSASARERESVDEDEADSDDDESLSADTGDDDVLEEIPIDLVAPVQGGADGLEMLSEGGGVMLPLEDPDLAFPDHAYDSEEPDEPSVPRIPDEVLEELEILRARVDELSDAEQAAAIERRSLLDANESLRAQNEVYQDRLLKMKADWEKQRKRVERDHKENIRRETERVVRAILPVVDHMELALQHANAGSQGSGLLEGVELILRQFHKTLGGLGVSQVEVEPGQVFDPALHDAMMREHVDGIDPNRVTRVLRTGYLMDDRLLRAARVAVAEPPPRADEEDEDEATVEGEEPEAGAETEAEGRPSETESEAGGRPTESETEPVTEPEAEGRPTESETETETGGRPTESETEAEGLPTETEPEPEDSKPKAKPKKKAKKAKAGMPSKAATKAKRKKRASKARARADKQNSGDGDEGTQDTGNADSEED